MAAGLITVPFFLLFIAQAWASEVVGAVHGVAYLSPSKGEGYSQVHWRRGSNLKIASREKGKEVQYPNSNYKERLELFPNNTLKISHLQKSDSSTYHVYLEDYNGKEHVESIILNVYDLVPKPTVKAEVIKHDLELCEAILECSVDLEGVTYEWIDTSKIWQDDEDPSKKRVFFNPSVKTYMCQVSNPVSSNNASLIYRHPCSWTGDSSAAASCVTINIQVALGHLLLLLFLLTLA
ncbi:PREDICTED: CD48 antigen-like isoform X2 [Calidris pugnax]|uniref:CD48 antigen-like isoform X2 n=1 Tax=Calidris pugnax TaxID=198806 RepID=UPI00071E524F|nr:PREDICTED: CD48 antigen-like isoform X2 [Calidris pugnax]